jgi:predicted ester cyclase
MTSQADSRKAVVVRLIDEVLNGGRLHVIDEVYSPAMAAAAHRWIEPFRAAFPDVRMEVVQLVAEDNTVVGRFRCSATHTGPWRGVAPTGRAFRNVAEVYFFTVTDGRITAAWGLEDNESRIRQLGISL